MDNLARQRRWLPSDITSEDLAERFDRFKASLSALRAYQPEAYDGDVRIVWARDERHSAQHFLDWRRAVPNAVERIAPGDHHSIITAIGNTVVAVCLNAWS
jgi:hypothetical protein